MPRTAEILADRQAYATTLPADRAPRILTFSAALDAHDVTRAWAYGYAVRYSIQGDDTRRGLAIWRDDFSELSAGRLADLHRAVFLVDDGKTVVPHYVAGWNPTAHPGAMFLQPYPTNPNGATRPDNGETIDYGTWFASCRVAYHLKVSALSVTLTQVPAENGAQA